MTAISIGAPRHRTVPLAADRAFAESDRGITIPTTGIRILTALAGLSNGWWTILSSTDGLLLTVQADAGAVVDIVSRDGTVIAGPPKKVVGLETTYDEILVKLMAPNVLQISGDIA